MRAKVKIIEAYNDEELQDEINKFLSTPPLPSLIDIKFSITRIEVEDCFKYTALIIYK